MLASKPFLEEYGNLGVKQAQVLGAPSYPSVRGFIPNRASDPVNPTSLIGGNIVTSNLNFNGSPLIASHFKLLYKLDTISIYKSDGTTPSGNLTGVLGDICYGADSGKTYYCSTTGTTWTAF